MSMGKKDRFFNVSLKRYGWLKQLFKLIIGAALLVYIFREQARIHEVIDVIGSCNRQDLIIALSLFVLTKFQISARIYTISRHYITTPFTTILKDVFIANFFNTILPVGTGELYRIKNLSPDHSSLLESAAMVNLDRTFGLVATLTIGALSFVGTTELSGLFDPRMVIIPLTIGAAIFFLTGWYLKRHTTPFRWLARIQLFFTFCLEHPRQALGLYLFSVVIIFTLVVSIFFLGKGLGLNLALINFLRFYPFVLIVTLIPISIGGLGVRELATISAFGMVGVSNAHCVSLGLTQYGMMVVVAFVGLVLLLIVGQTPGKFLQKDSPLC